MFEDRTYENLVKEAIAAAPPGIDTRTKSIYGDAVKGICFKLAEQYVDLEYLLQLTQLATAPGEYLDAKGEELGISRNPATSARYAFSYVGTAPAQGSRFFDSDTQQYFVYEEGELTAQQPGTMTNGIATGTAAIPVNEKGLESAVFGELIQYGSDIETDDEYRQRIREKIAGPAENGNRQHYKSWCEEIAGVGRARILPLWNGNNTVKGVLISPEGTPVSEEIVQDVQEHIDPGGTGLGDGMANIGAVFTAESADALEIDVSFTVTLRAGATIDAAKSQAEDSLKQYLKSLMMGGEETPVVRIAEIGARITSLPAVLDYKMLTLNAGGSNIEVGELQAAVLGTLEVVAE